MHTVTMMDDIDSKPDRFLRGGACDTTVPTIQVVVEGHDAWGAPDRARRLHVGVQLQLPSGVPSLRAEAIAKATEAERLFADFRFVDATFAAQAVWKAAAEFEDLALGNPVGSAELGRNTTTSPASEARDGVQPAAVAVGARRRLAGQR